MPELDDFLKDERLVAARRPPARRGPGRFIAAALLLLAALGTGAWIAWRQQAGAPPPKPVPSLPEAVEPPASGGERHPIAAVQTEVPVPAGEPLPSLADSDAALLGTLQELLGSEDAGALFVPSHLVPRIVATVDALPERRLARRVLPVHPAAGRFLVATQDGRTLLAPENSQRYDRHVALLESLDTEAAVAAYVHYYPLFQQAYRELGYPDRHFNDRLVEVIDHLLAAPDAPASPELRAEKSGWAYADPSLETASAGHRLLFRLGPAHAARVKARLRELRAALTAAAPGTPPTEPAQP